MTTTTRSTSGSASPAFRNRAFMRIATSDNFWAMGDTGPCGPCSEIFFDHGEEIPGGPPGSADADGDRFIEIWNLVFMQFEALPGGERVEPAAPFDRHRHGSRARRGGAAGQARQLRHRPDARADPRQRRGDGRRPRRTAQGFAPRDRRPLRASSFLVADGVLPSNEGRGYVLRRIMRRAMRHAQFLGARDPLMWRLVPALTREMGQAYPELIRAEALIAETLKLEETRFRATLARGLAILEDETRDLPAGAKLAGEVAFKLYDTYGFPLDLTQDALRARGLGVDAEGFAAAMERQRAEARRAWAGSGEAATETVWFALRERLGATEFLGYETEIAEGVVEALVMDGAEVASLREGEKGVADSQPDAVLRRVRRTGRRYRRDDRLRRARARPGRQEEARRSHRP